MALVLGLDVNYYVAAAVPFTSNIVTATIGLTSPIAANQKQHIKARVPITVGATGGARWTLVCPAGASFIIMSEVVNTVAPSITPGEIAFGTINAVFTNALANAGNHWVDIEATVVNGATAGTVDLQFAQNSSDVLTMTVQQGGWMKVTKF